MEKLLKLIIRVMENRNRKITFEINNDTNLRTELKFDSLDLAELTVLVENEFGVDIFEDGVVLTIGEIVQKLRL